MGKNRLERRMSAAVWIGVFVAFVVVGCSASYSVDPSAIDAGPDATNDGAAAPGTAGGVCYPNATCNDGLACVGQRCVSTTDAATTHAPNDAEALGPDGNDAQVSDASDGSSGACMAPIMALAANDCMAGKIKCVAEQVCYTMPQECMTDESDLGVSCNTNANCNAGTVCCATLPNVDLKACPIAAHPMLDSSISTTCRVMCQSAELQICTTSADCRNGLTCVAATSPGAFAGAMSTLHFGVCK